MEPEFAKKEDKSLKSVDPALFEIIKDEEARQRNGLELIASENFTSRAVMDALGSVLTNKYSEGYPGKRYYGGNECIDRLETLTQKRALEAFGLDSKIWGVNVQAYSGSVANFAVQTALLQPGDRFMGLALTDGGHLSHGFYRNQSKVNISSRYFESLPYGVVPETGLIDYDKLQELAKLFRPRMIIGGASAYPRDWDWRRMREICDSVKAMLMGDMAHFSGLVAGKVVSSPFEYCDVVTTTTHKSLRSTRAALIFYKLEYAKQINSAVFPGCQGGPHNHAIAGICTQLREVSQPEWKLYAQQIVSNCKTLATTLTNKGYKLATDGTDTHLLLWDLRPLGITGSKMEALCEAAAITLNKNTVHGDKSALSPGGVRIGTPALTTRGLKETEFEQVGEFLHRAVRLTIALKTELMMMEENINPKTGKLRLKPFKEALADFKINNDSVSKLRTDVMNFAGKFFLPGRMLA